MANDSSSKASTNSANGQLVGQHIGQNAPHFKRFADQFEIFPTPVVHADHHETHSSALSPAAYFVDLIRLVSKHIPKHDLRHRRPDLWRMPLDRAHTEELVPYLQIVNKTMTTHFGGRAKAFDRLANARFPFDQPVNLPLAQIRTYLGHFDVELIDIYETLGLSKIHPAWVVEALGLSTQNELTRLGKVNSRWKWLSSEFGGLKISSASSLGGVDLSSVFMKQTGLTPDELAELVQIFELSFSAETDGDGNAIPQRMEKLDKAMLDRLNRFLRLAKRLDWSFSDLDWGLRSVNVDLARKWGRKKRKGAAPMGAEITADTLAELAHLKRICDRYKLPVDEACCFLQNVNTNPGIATANKVGAKSLFDRVFNTPPFHHPNATEAIPEYRPYLDTEGAAMSWSFAHLDVSEKKVPEKNAKDADQPDQGNKDADRLDQGIRSSLQAALGVSSDDLQAIVDHLGDSGHLDISNIQLDVPTLTQLYRLSRLAHALDMEIPECLILLKCITGRARHHLASPVVFELDDLETVIYWAGWLSKAGLRPHQLEYLTTGKLSPQARRFVDIGPSPKELAELMPGLKPWPVLPKSFTGTGFSPDEAHGICEALKAAGFVDDHGLCRKSISRHLVIEALATYFRNSEDSDLAAVVESLVTVLEGDIKLALRSGTTEPRADSETGSIAKAILKQLEERDVLGDDLVFAAGSEPLFRTPSDPTALLPESRDPEEESRLAIVRKLLSGKAKNVRAIVDTINHVPEHQSDLTMHRLAGAFHQAPDLIMEVLEPLGLGKRKVAGVITDAQRQNVARLLYFAKTLDLAPEDLGAMLGDLELTSSKIVNGLKPPQPPVLTEEWSAALAEMLSGPPQTALMVEQSQPDIWTIGPSTGWKPSGTLPDLSSAVSTLDPLEHQDYQRDGGDEIRCIAASPDGQDLYMVLLESIVFRCRDVNAPGSQWERLPAIPAGTIDALTFVDNTLWVSAAGGEVYWWKKGRNAKLRWEKYRTTLGGPGGSSSLKIALYDGEPIFGTSSGGTYYLEWRRPYWRAHQIGQGLPRVDLASDYVHYARVWNLWGTPDGRSVFSLVGRRPALYRLGYTSGDGLWTQMSYRLAPEDIEQLVLASDGRNFFTVRAGTGNVFRYKVGHGKMAVSEPLASEIQHQGARTLLPMRDGKSLMVGTDHGLFQVVNEGTDWERVRWEKLSDLIVDTLVASPDGASFFAVADEIHRFDISMDRKFEVRRQGDGFKISRVRAAALDSIDTLRTFQEFFELVKRFKENHAETTNTADKLGRYLLHENSSTLRALSGWKESQVETLLKHFDMMSGVDGTESAKGSVNAPDPRKRCAQLTKMRHCFDLAAKFGVDMTMLTRLCSLHHEAARKGPRSDNTNASQKNSLAAYSEAAQSLLGVLRSKYSKEQWAKTFDPIRDRLNELERDALAALFLRDLQVKFPVTEDFPDRKFETLQDLSGYLLIDVEMSGCTETSFVKEAIGCLQVYIERCRMNIEEGVSLPPDEIPETLWAWMGHFRMWEANRKVFFYPENYIEPTQRKQATPLFKELQSELQQGDVTDEAVTDAYINYFDKLDELASLEIIDSHVASVTNPNSGEDEETIFVIGRTSGTPPVYYVRSATLDRSEQRFTGWRPWEKIDLTVPANKIVALYAHNRLYIFWIETTTTKRAHQGAQDKLAKHISTTGTVKYSYQKVSGAWLPPQTHPDCEKLVASHDEPSGAGTNTVVLPAITGLSAPPDKPVASLIVKWDWSLSLEPSAWIADTWQNAERNFMPTMTPLSDDVRDWNELKGSAAPTSPGAIQALGNRYVQSTVTSLDGRTLFVAVVDGVWQATKGLDGGIEYWQQVGAKLASKTVLALVMHPDGKTLFASTVNEGVWRYHKGADDIYAEWEQLGTTLSQSTVRSLAMSPDGGMLFAGAYSVGVWRIKLDSNSDIAEWHSIGDQIRQKLVVSLAITPDGKTLYAGGERAGVLSGELDEDGNIPKWTQVGQRLKASAVGPLAMSPDGRMLFAGTRQQGVWRKRLDDDADWQQLIGATGSPGAVSLAVTSDGRQLFAGTQSYGAHRIQFDVDGAFQDWQRIGKRFKNLGFFGLALSPDDATLFAGTEDDGYFCVVLSDTSLFLGGSRPLLLRYISGSGKQAQYSCEPLTTGAVHDLRHKLVTGGLEQLLSIPSQRTCRPPRVDMSKVTFLSPDKNITEIDQKDLLDLDLSDPYAIYFREIFFHIPFLIADALQRNQQFEHARKWYQFILDPTRPGRSQSTIKDNKRVDAPDSDGMWRFLPFREEPIKTLTQVLKKKSLRDELAKDPFDPHAIAATRLGAYEKAVAMKYLDNLLDWGDMLFAQDNWEAINQATILYVRALNLLGSKPPPQRAPVVRQDKQQTAGDVADGPDHKPNHPVLDEIVAPTNDAKQLKPSWEDNPFFDVSDFFSLPENHEFAAYWERAQDRLYKIRHCMNIKGIVRQLALFQPPIDPAQLVRAMAAGGSLASAASQLQPAVPHYRFSVMLQQAKAMTETVIQLGSALLSALEKQDAEALNLLHTTQEQATLKLSRTVKEAQIKDAEHTVAALTESLNGAQMRIDHYQGLMETNLLPSERASLALTAGGIEAQQLAHVVRFEAVIAHLIPTVFGFADGDFQPGSSISEAATLSDAMAGILGQQAASIATMSQYERRAEDWDLQRSMAEFELSQINSHIEAAGIRLEIAKREIELHEATTKQAQEKKDFFESKYTNKELYQWMAGRLSMVYFQTYKLALELARSAERAYQYECNTDQTFVDATQWDSGRKGLQAGEALMLGLHQLEKAHLDGDERELEIEKTISLMQLRPTQLSKLKSTGSCSFEFDELLFDQDFPGHYNRRIKTVSVSIPAVVGPYQNIQATLIQTRDRVLTKADADAAGKLLTNKVEEIGAGVLRSNWRRSQQIAISKGVDDSGMFQLNFEDERYLPFEGTGALSNWTLTLPKAANRSLDFSSISDVVIHLRYTALDGGAAFRGKVIAHDEMKKYSGHSLVSLRQKCAGDWQNFAPAPPKDTPEDGEPQRKKSKPLAFSLNADRLALNCSAKKFAGHLAIQPLWADGSRHKNPGLSIALTDQKKPKPLTIAWTDNGLGICELPGSVGEDLKAEITADDPSILKGLIDIALIVDFEGTLTWN